MGSRIFSGNISSYQCLCEDIVSSVMSDSLQPHGPQSTRILCPWHSQGKNTGQGFHALLQGIFPTSGSNPHLLRLLHWQVSSLPLVSPGKTPDLSHVYITLLQRITEGAPAPGHVLQSAGSIFMHVLPATYKRIEPL